MSTRGGPSQRGGASIPQGQLGGVAAGEHNFGGLTIEGIHKPVKNIQTKRVYVFQTIRVNGDFTSVIRQFFYGIYQFVGRSGVEVALQFQTKAAAVLIDGDQKI
jgi:hypothetical protein